MFTTHVRELNTNLRYQFFTGLVPVRIVTRGESRVLASSLPLELEERREHCLPFTRFPGPPATPRNRDTLQRVPVRTTGSAVRYIHI